MFRSARRAVVYPQRDHAVLAAGIAAAFGNGRFHPPPLPFDSFVRGVALHDRGYAEHDTDEIGAASKERWLEIQWAGFGEHDDDPVVDVVVSMHVRRLVGAGPAYEEMGAAIPRLCKRAGVTRAAAEAADEVTALCDGIAFSVCMERPAQGEDTIGGQTVRYAVDGLGGVHMSPWPLALPSLDLLLVGFEAGGYPRRLERLVELVRLRPG
jgi:hypothetical protein